MSIIKNIATSSTPSATVFVGQWTDATDYKKNQQTAMDGDLYLCVVSHTSATSTEPGTGEDWTDVWVRQIDSVSADQLAAISGADNPDASNVFQVMSQDIAVLTAGENIDAYKICYMGSDGEIYLATNNDTEAKASPVGLALESIVEDATGNVRVRSGFVTNGSWAWTAGDQLYLSTAGDLTNIVPTTDDVHVVGLGVALSPTKIYFHPQEGILNPVIWYNANLFEIDYTPSAYTPSNIEGVTTALNQLSAHLKGIDAKLAQLEGA